MTFRSGSTAAILAFEIGLLESAVLRPRMKQHYEATGDLADLAAEYAIAISGNHPFLDGNRRTAFFAMAVFLQLNGAPIWMPESEAAAAMQGLAAGTLTEDRFREILRGWTK